MKKNEYEINNIVRIGDRNKREIYAYSILIRMSPSIYSKEECIIIQVRESLLEFAEVLLRRFKYAGLREVSRKKTALKNEKEGYTLPNGWEIKLEKIPVLQMMEEDG